MTIILITLLSLFIRIPLLLSLLILKIGFFTSNLAKLDLDIFKIFIADFLIKEIKKPYKKKNLYKKGKFYFLFYFL